MNAMRMSDERLLELVQKTSFGWTTEEEDELLRELRRARAADAELWALKNQALFIEDAIGKYFNHNGAEHEDKDCPMDDTCECPLVNALNDALVRLHVMIK